MIINPFDIKKNKVSVQNSENEPSRYVDIDEVIKYISANYSKYLSTQNRNFFEEKIREYLCLKYLIYDISSYKDLIEQILNKIFGYGMLQKYIENPDISDIRVVKYNSIYIKNKGGWEKVNESFESKEEFRDYIKYCAIRNNEEINFETPLVIMNDKEYMLRLEAGISPINILNDNLVIRIHKFDKDLKISDLFKRDMLDKNSICIINQIIKNPSNLIIAGKGGSGKTTLLRAILKEIDNKYAITANEETLELYITDKNVVERQINLKQNISLEKLLKHSMVMSNDILVVGELKGEEVSTFIDAISTGHIGFSTVHADSADTVIDRLTLLFKRDPKTLKYSSEYVHELLYKSINYIIFLKEYKITDICKIEFSKGLNKYYINEIYKRGKS